MNDNIISDKIKALMNKKKQISQDLDAVDKESLNYDFLEQEKEQVENEVRKAKTLKYEQEQLKEDLNYIKKSYLYLKKLNLVKSQYQFSTEFLNKNKYYLGMLLCENRKPSIDGINTLIKNMICIKDLLEETVFYSSEVRALNNLIVLGKNIITNRLFKYL